MTFTGGVKDGRLRQKLNGFERRYLIQQRRKLDMWNQRLRDTVKRGNYFKNPTPHLQNTVWADKPKRVGRLGLSAQSGWGVSYGPVLEFGVSPAKQAGWEIVANKAPRLRWLSMDSGKIRYAKRVWHPWNHGDKGSAPHWEKALDKLRPSIRKDLAATVTEALR
jgi:hypothetical protein